MNDLTEGQHVTHNGKAYSVFRVTEHHVGLIDPDHALIIDDTNGQQVAHIAVPRSEVEA